MTENTRLKIDFGRATYPDDARAVWGARLIWPNDLLHDRQDIASSDDEARFDLIAWLNGPNRGDGAISKMRDKLMVPSELGWTQSGTDEVTLYEDGTGKIVGSPQGSFGYVYVAAWLT
jgi:hypothetical protein